MIILSNNCTRPLWYDKYDSCLDGLDADIFYRNSESETILLVLKSGRALNTFIYAFTIAGFAIERYFLVCKASHDSMLHSYWCRVLFYIIVTAGPLIIWGPLVATIIKDDGSLFLGDDYMAVLKGHFSCEFGQLMELIHFYPG